MSMKWNAQTFKKSGGDWRTTLIKKLICAQVIGMGHEQILLKAQKQIEKTFPMISERKDLDSNNR